MCSPHPRRFQDPTEWVAYAGTTSLSGSEASTVRARVARIVTHPAYDSDTADFDVAVLELGSPLPFSRHVQPVCLPAATHIFPPRRKCLISGWGYLKEDFRKCPSFRGPAGNQAKRRPASLSAGSAVTVPPHYPRVPRLRIRLLANVVCSQPQSDARGNFPLPPRAEG